MLTQTIPQSVAPESSNQQPDRHSSRLRAYQVRKGLKMLGVITLGIFGLFFLSLLMLIR